MKGRTTAWLSKELLFFFNQGKSIEIEKKGRTKERKKNGNRNGGKMIENDRTAIEKSGKR